MIMIYNMYYYILILSVRKGSTPIPVAARSKCGWFCGRSLTEIVDVCFECCVLSGRGRGLCDDLITRPE